MPSTIRILASTLAAAILSSPALAADRCPGVPNGVDFVSQFELYAVNTTLPNSDPLGAPLQIAPTGDITVGSTNGRVWTLATQASYPHTFCDSFPGQFCEPYLDMFFQGIQGDSAGKNIVSVPVASGQPLTFVETNPPQTPATIYCAAPGTVAGTFLRLTVNGRADAFSICGDPVTGLDVVVYDVAENAEYDYCYSVDLKMIEP